jgi:hypothetical protein
MAATIVNKVNAVTNKRAELVNVRAASKMSFLTVGSRSYAKEFLRPGLRNGQSFDFVITDTGKFGTSLDVTSNLSQLTERKVTVPISLGNVAVQTNAIEKVTDLDWDREVATPQGTKLATGMVKQAVAEDIGKQNMAFVGKGFGPLAQAGQSIQSLTDEKIYGFINPRVQGVLTSNGQSFVPLGAVKSITDVGALGTFGNVEYHSERFMPSVIVTSALASQMASATVKSYTAGNAGIDTIALSGVSATVPAGMPIWIEDVYACDTVGGVTTYPKAFIAVSACAPSAVAVRSVDFAGEGTKEAALIDGSSIATSALAGKSVTCPPADTYHCGIVRAEGSYEFDTLDQMDFNDDKSKVTSINGVTMHENKDCDKIAGVNINRWDIVAVAGTVEPRVQAMVLVADGVNQVNA